MKESICITLLSNLASVINPTAVKKIMQVLKLQNMNT